MEEERLIGILEAGRYVHRSSNAIQGAVARGELHRELIGSRMLFRIGDLDQWKERSEAGLTSDQIHAQEMQSREEIKRAESLARAREQAEVDAKAFQAREAARKAGIGSDLEARLAAVVSERMDVEFKRLEELMKTHVEATATRVAEMMRK